MQENELPSGEYINALDVVYEVVQATDNKEVVWRLIEARHKETGGHNGIELVELKSQTGLTLDEVKAALVELHKEGKTKVREQKNGRAIYVK